MGRPKANTKRFLLGQDADDTDRYFDLRRLADYSCLSVRTLRALLHLPVDPLPAFRVEGKILVRKSQFDAWLARRKYKSTAEEVSKLFDKVVKEFKELL